MEGEKKRMRSKWRDDTPPWGTLRTSTRFAWWPIKQQDTAEEKCRWLWLERVRLTKKYVGIWVIVNAVPAEDRWNQ